LALARGRVVQRLSWEEVERPDDEDPLPYRDLGIKARPARRVGGWPREVVCPHL